VVQFQTVEGQSFQCAESMASNPPVGQPGDLRRHAAVVAIIGVAS